MIALTKKSLKMEKINRRNRDDQRITVQKYLAQDAPTICVNYGLFDRPAYYGGVWIGRIIADRADQIVVLFEYDQPIEICGIMRTSEYVVISYDPYQQEWWDDVHNTPVEWTTDLGYLKTFEEERKIKKVS